jgi:AcrR family transcriptional regulator
MPSPAKSLNKLPGKPPGKSSSKSNGGAKRRARPRRSNAERSATTRGKLIQAAIDSLYEEGYSATTTISVAARARVSRGAMLHQFPTRVEMLLAVAEFIVADHSRIRREQLAPFGEGLKRFYAAADVSWAVSSRPSSIALLEIMMATRSDKDLRKGFAPFLKLWAEMRRAAAQRMAVSLGIPDALDDLEVLISLHQSTMRGLAIELMFAHDADDVERMRQMQTAYERAYAEKLVAMYRERKKE